MKELCRFVALYCLFLGAAASYADSDEFQSWVDIRDAGVVKQSLDYTCGVASMATLLTAYFQHPTSEEQLLALLEEKSDEWGIPSNWRDTGVSFSAMAYIANHFGLGAVGVAVDSATLATLSVPAITYFEYRGFPHFSVIRSVDSEGRVQLADPSWGNRILSNREFLSLWQSPDTGKGKLLLLQSRKGNESAPVNTNYFKMTRAFPLIQLNAPRAL